MSKKKDNLKHKLAILTKEYKDLEETLLEHSQQFHDKLWETKPSGHAEIYASHEPYMEGQSQRLEELRSQINEVGRKLEELKGGEQ